MPADDSKFAEILRRLEPQLQQKWGANEEEMVDYVYLTLAEDILRAELESLLTNLRAEFIRYRQASELEFQLAPLLSPRNGTRVELKILDKECAWDFSLGLTESKRRVFLGVRLEEPGFALPESFPTAWDLRKTIEQDAAIRKLARDSFSLLIEKELTDPSSKKGDGGGI